ncbi:hypothetical protein COOONC_27542 [Cooperia oncophora]
MLAAITLILSVIVILDSKREKDRVKPPQPAQYAQIKRNQLPPPLSISEHGSGCVNSSYDDMTVITASLPEQRVPPFSYERHNRNKRARIRPNSMPQPHFDQYSGMTPSIRDDFSSKLQSRRSFSTANGRFRKSCELPSTVGIHGDLKKSDEPNEQEFGKPPGTLTSLISFDPKSRTLLRVREHRESDEDEAEGYSRIEKDCSQDTGLYERIRSRGSRDNINACPDVRNLLETRLRDPSHDSLPSMMAPVLTTENPTHSSTNATSSDFGFPGSRYCPPSSSSSQTDRHLSSETRGIEPPEIRYMGDQERHLATTSSDYKSNLRVESKDSRTAIVHYHSISEFRLTNSKSPTQTVPVITGAGLLV